MPTVHLHRQRRLHGQSDRPKPSYVLCCEPNVTVEQAPTRWPEKPSQRWGDMPLSRIESEIKPTGGAATLSAHEDQGPAHKTHDSIFHAMQGTDPSNFGGVRHVNSNRAISSAVLVSREPITPNQLGKFNTLASYECRHYSTNVPLLTRRPDTRLHAAPCRLAGHHLRIARIRPFIDEHTSTHKANKCSTSHASSRS